jgi:RNA polymerase sigma factor (TIGR02999 family)
MNRGDESAFARLVPVVHEELRDLAARYLSHERPGHTLQPTALVHEAYIRLLGKSPSVDSMNWDSRAHFFGAVARSMRQILINHAVKKRAAKRGGQRQRVALDDALAVFEERTVDIVILDDALDRLAELDPRQGRIVELRFFAGLDVEDTARVLGLSKRTVEREWTVARAWLRLQVAPDATFRRISS